MTKGLLRIGHASRWLVRKGKENVASSEANCEAADLSIFSSTHCIH